MDFFVETDIRKRDVCFEEDRFHIFQSADKIRTEGFIENVGQSRPTVYFKIGLYKCLKKFPAQKTLKFITALFWE